MPMRQWPCHWVALAAALTVAAVPAATLAETDRAATEAARDADTTPASGATALDGFYLRAGFVADGSKPTRFQDEDCSSTSPAALYGCGDGVDGAPLSSLGDFGTKAGIDLGLGYVAAPALRLEAVLQHRPRFSFDGRANFLQTTARQEVSAKLSTVTGMLAAYVDLPALGLPRVGPLSPFVGAGAGLSRIRIGVTRMEFPKTRTVVPGGPADRFRVDGHGGGCSVFGGQNDAGPSLALYGLRRRQDRQGNGPDRIPGRAGAVSALPRSNQGCSAAPRLGPVLALRILRTSFPLCPQQRSVTQPCRRAEHQRIAGCVKTPSERSNDPPNRHSRESGNPGGVEWGNGAVDPSTTPGFPLSRLCQNPIREGQRAPNRHSRKRGNPGRGGAGKRLVGPLQDPLDSRFRGNDGGARE